MVRCGKGWIHRSLPIQASAHFAVLAGGTNLVYLSPRTLLHLEGSMNKMQRMVINKMHMTSPTPPKCTSIAYSFIFPAKQSSLSEGDESGWFLLQSCFNCLPLESLHSICKGMEWNHSASIQIPEEPPHSITHSISASTLSYSIDHCNPIQSTTTQFGSALSAYCLTKTPISHTKSV